MRRIRTPDDVAWFLRHTQAFQGGRVTDLHVHKQHLLDESSGREVAAGTVLTAMIRYELSIRDIEGSYAANRVAKLTMKGVTDFSVFEQEGADFSEISIIHADTAGGRLRLWFDPQGELYVICDEAEIEEVSIPTIAKPISTGMAEWTFQAESGETPNIKWLLERLDRAGVPCAWRSVKPPPSTHPAVRWTGHLLPASMHDGPRPAGVQVQAYGPFDGSAFGITLRTSGTHDDETGRVLMTLADIIARSFPGMCLARNQVMERDEWLAR